MSKFDEATNGDLTRRRALGLAAVAFGAAAIVPNFALARELEPGDDHGSGGHGADDPPGDDHGGVDDTDDTNEDTDDDSGGSSGSSGSSGHSHRRRRRRGR